MPVPDTHLFQRAWVVDDIQVAMQYWIDVHGAGPFFLSPNVQSQKAYYLGEPAWFEISAAIAQAVDIQIELIQQHEATCPIFRDRADHSRESVHHVGVVASDLDAIIQRYASRGIPLYFEDWFGETRYVFVDTRAERGYLTEYVQGTASFNRVRASVRDAADHWSGAAPIRSLASHL